MNTLRIHKPSFDTLADTSGDREDTISKKTAKDQESTMATVLMTRLHDPKLQDKFHRLMVLADDEKVLSTFPLNRKITLVGRSRRNHVQIKDPLVSVKHLTVSVANNACVVNDMDSSNGTFINGERLTGVRILNDGDEIMIGKTMLRFASRQSKEHMPPEQVKRMPFFNKRFYIPVAAGFCLAVAAAFVFQGIARDRDGYVAKALASIEKAPVKSRPSSGKGAAASQLAVAAGGAKELNHSVQPSQRTLLQQALAEYAAGRLDSAIQTLRILSAAREQTSEAFQAKQMLAILSTVQKLHTQALKAQEQKKFAKALDCWDRLLAMDMELIGDRPSFLAVQAEEHVQSLSYVYALDAFRHKNHEKARQLCQVILKIDPKNQQALALLAKIDSKA
jgi:pSer/pThr/pTyr-binding forkhead associated (FHA) protein